jgi:hypothetical protein
MPAMTWTHDGRRTRRGRQQGVQGGDGAAGAAGAVNERTSRHRQAACLAACLSFARKSLDFLDLSEFCASTTDFAKKIGRKQRTLSDIHLVLGQFDNAGVAAACFVPCDLGPHAWSARVFNFAQTPRATLPNLRNPGVLNVPPSPKGRSRTPDGKPSRDFDIILISQKRQAMRDRVGRRPRL